MYAKASRFCRAMLRERRYEILCRLSVCP